MLGKEGTKKASEVTLQPFLLSSHAAAWEIRSMLRLRKWVISRRAGVCLGRGCVLLRTPENSFDGSVETLVL